MSNRIRPIVVDGILCFARKPVRRAPSRSRAVATCENVISNGNNSRSRCAGRASADGTVGGVNRYYNTSTAFSLLSLHSPTTLPPRTTTSSSSHIPPTGSSVQTRPTHAHPVDTVHTCYRVLHRVAAAAAHCRTTAYTVGTIASADSTAVPVRIQVRVRYYYYCKLCDNRRGGQKNTDGHRVASSSSYHILVTYVRTYRTTVRCAGPPPPSAVCWPFRPESLPSDSEYRR